MFLLANGSCNQCVNPCLTCNSTSYCLTCQLEFYFNGIGGCNLCSLNCLSCNSINCLSCSISYYLSANKTCMACKILYPKCSTCT